MMRPCNPLESHSEPRPFVYRYREPHAASRSTVLFIQGGPGLPGIGHQTWPIPDDLGVIQFDPRGIGCNRTFAECPRRPEFSSTQIADDLRAVLQELPADPLVLWGSSYGTVVGTILASKLEQSKTRQPVAVLFEGTVGSAFTEHHPLDGYIDEWNRLLESLPGPVAGPLRTSPPPLGFTPLVWGRMLEMYLPIGETSDGGNLLRSLLSELDTPGEKLRQLLRDTAAEAPLSDDVVRTYTEIACSELFRNVPSADSDFALDAGRLVPATQDLCHPGALRDPFSAARWPIRRTPIVYIMGLSDPATPPWQSLLHINAQTNTNRLVVAVPGGGHESLSVALGDCAPALITALFTGPVLVEREAARCVHRTTITKLARGSEPMSLKPASSR